MLLETITQEENEFKMPEVDMIVSFFKSIDTVPHASHSLA